MAGASTTSKPFSFHETVFPDNQSGQSGNDSESSKCPLDEPSLSVTLITFYSFIFVVGLAGNILALYVFLGIHRKRNSIQVYLLNVAIADLLLIFCLPFRILYHTNQDEWTLGAVFCKVVGLLFYMNMYISITFLGLISLDRYAKINRSFQQHKGLTPKHSIYSCCFVWMCAVLGFLVMLVFSIRENDQSAMCFHYRNKKKVKGEAIFNFILVILFWFTFLLLILSYAKIAKNLLRISKRRSNFPNSRKYAKTARNSFIVLIIFTICFVPYHGFRFIYITSQLRDTSCYWKKIFHKTNEIMLVFSAFNSCLDPVMYFLMSSNIRKTVYHLLFRRFQGESSRSESTSEFKQAYSLQDSTAARIQANI
ncbi:probable G-protein coupled receptor 34 [Ornithorhynchus anatinus]|uniref:Probable G-protein coupled receptor 34 n=1 Tax=Ornithorhynchus anatinus TaxID=9258 RepID=F7DPA1_ORNAN|nr:probable G-protein coupled receptor 34 [Ornithorhynchus anatinus]XP_028902263.1 probable G-protein coupled receptor 34 [Ornithorhynchus anatinus]